MKNLISIILAFAVCVSAHAQVNVQKTSGTNAITGNLVIGDGKSLTATGTGNITATNLASGVAVTSITGTVNQITASAATGAVTLSIPNSPVFVTPNIGAATGTSLALTNPGGPGVVISTTQGSDFERYSEGATQKWSIYAPATGGLAWYSSVLTGDVWSLTGSGNGTLAGNLTVSGTGLQTIGGALSTVRMPGYGAGAATFDSSGNITSASDERMKVVDRPFTTGLDSLRKLTPQVYHWNARSGLNTSDVNVSLMAQDLIAAGVPEAVFTERTVDVTEDVSEAVEVDTGVKDFAGRAITRSESRTTKRPKLDKDGKVLTQRVASTYTVSDRAVIAVLVNAIKELDARVKVLESK